MKEKRKDGLKIQKKHQKADLDEIQIEEFKHNCNYCHNGSNGKCEPPVEKYWQCNREKRKETLRNYLLVEHCLAYANFWVQCPLPQ